MSTRCLSLEQSLHRVGPPPVEVLSFFLAFLFCSIGRHNMKVLRADPVAYTSQRALRLDTLPCQHQCPPLSHR